MAGYRRGLALPGSVVVVAGAAGPVGRAVAPALAAAGATPVLLDADPAALARVAAVCGDRGRAARALAVDLADAAAVADAVRRLTADGGRIDGWVHCPGGASGGAERDPAAGAGPSDTEPPGTQPSGTEPSGTGPPGTPLPGSVTGDLLDLPPDAVVGVLDGAVLAAVHGARAAVPAMAARGGGVLVVVASLHGQVARPHAAAPGMAGAALRVLAAALRQELRAGTGRGGAGRGGTGRGGVAVTTVLAGEPDPSAPALLRFRPERVAATVLAALRRPGLEKVAGGPLAKAVVHGHALVPAATEWLVARAARAPAGGAPDRGPAG